MKLWILAASVVAMGATAGMALAQSNPITERRAGLRQMGQHMEAIGGIVQSRGDQAAIVARVDQMIPFFQTLPNLVPAESLTPPVAQGTGEGQTRALAVIDANRADFATREGNIVTALTALKAAAQTGSVTPDLLRSTGATCGACHQQYRAR